MIYNRILDERHRLEKEITTLQAKLKSLPNGKLTSTCTKKYTKWAVSDGHKQIYLPKSQRPLAEKLALKKYLQLRLKNLTDEQRAIDFYLKHHNQEAYQAEETIINSPEYGELIQANFTPLTKELNEWMHASYETNNAFSENLTIKAHTGIRVRSKSESLIAMVLFKNKIPFRYECKLELGEIIFYPDFTIRHPITGELFYWEHFGMMDDPVYSMKAYSKLQSYTLHNIIPTIQLITTYETKNYPLSIEAIEKLVEYYFL